MQNDPKWRRAAAGAATFFPQFFPIGELCYHLVGRVGLCSGGAAEKVSTAGLRNLTHFAELLVELQVVTMDSRMLGLGQSRCCFMFPASDILPF